MRAACMILSLIASLCSVECKLASGALYLGGSAGRGRAGGGNGGGELQHGMRQT